MDVAMTNLFLLRILEAGTTGKHTDDQSDALNDSDAVGAESQIIDHVISDMG